MKIKKKFTFGILITLIGCVVVAQSYRVEIKSNSIRNVKRVSLTSVIGNDVNTPLIKDWTNGDFVVVEIITDKDLLALSRQLGSTMFADIWFCQNPNKAVRLNLPDVYTKSKSVNEWNLAFEKTGKVGKEIDKPIFKYEVVLLKKWNRDWEISDALKKDKKQVYYLKYDLKENPQDICISLAGGNITQGIKSNEIVIPAAEIENVLK